MVPPVEGAEALRTEPVCLDNGGHNDWAGGHELVHGGRKVVSPARLAGQRPLLQDRIHAKRSSVPDPEHLGFANWRIVANSNEQKPNEAGIDCQRSQDADGSRAPMPVANDLNTLNSGHCRRFPRQLRSRRNVKPLSLVALAAWAET